MSPALLQAKSICKRFGAMQVLTDIDLDVHAGQVLAILGDRGAGKSTFVKILSGAHAPTFLHTSHRPTSTAAPR